MRDRLRPGHAAAVLLSGAALVAALTPRRTPRAVFAKRAEAAGSADQLRTREVTLGQTRAGRPGAGGFYAAWPASGPAAAAATEVDFQYADLRHQQVSSLAGMWLFLATEVLFFGALLLPYAIYRATAPAAIAEASRHTQLAIGTANTVLLLTSSATFAYGIGCVQAGRSRALSWAAVATAGLGVCFIALKLYEWRLDLDENLFPGEGFAIGGPFAGPAQLFWSLYWIATGLHLLHMVIGVGLVGWIARAARAGRYTADYHTPVEMVGLYWSFVDLVWITLFPLLYLAGGVAR